MSKVISKYRGYSTNELKTRAEVPDQGNMTESGNDVLCSDITTNKIETALGLSITPNTLSTLCTSNSINKYSGFSPYTLSYSGGGGTLDSSLVFTKPTTNYTMGSFAGYNHGAITPGLDHIWNTTNVVTGGVATFDAYVDIGEMRYPSPAAALVLSIWDGGMLEGVGFTALSGVKDTYIFVTADSSTLFMNKTLTCRLHIGDSTTEFQQNGTNALCIVPNTTTYDRNIVVGPSGGAVTYQGDTNWGVWNRASTYKPSSVSSFETSTGYLELTILGSVTNSNQQISAYVTGTGVTNGAMDIFKSSRDGTYNANQQIIFEQYVGPQVYNDWSMTVTFGDEM
jgi:hypothetical protein